MPESFDDLARRHEENRANSVRLITESKVEWQLLKSFAAQMAADGKRLGAYPFKSERTISGSEILVLGNVAAIFEDNGETIRMPQDLCIRFTRRPPGSLQVVIGDSRLDDITWSLEPEIRNAEFVWCVVEGSKRYKAGELAEAVAAQLGQYLIEYERAFGREV
jgi:hypothetical protein